MKTNFVFDFFLNFESIDVNFSDHVCNQCRRYGVAWPPLASAYAPPFWFTQNTVIEHYATTKQRTMMEKEIIMFQHNTPWMFSRFFAKLLATNYCK